MKNVTVVITPAAQDNEEISSVFDGTINQAINSEVEDILSIPGKMWTRKEAVEYVGKYYKFFNVPLVS